MLKIFVCLNLCPIKVFKIIPEFKILKNTEFRQIIIASLLAKVQFLLNYFFFLFHSILSFKFPKFRIWQFSAFTMDSD